MFIRLRGAVAALVIVALSSLQLHSEPAPTWHAQIVLRDAGGQPISGASVRLHWLDGDIVQTPRQASTDAAGQVEFADLTGSRWHIAFRVPAAKSKLLAAATIEQPTTGNIRRVELAVRSTRATLNGRLKTRVGRDLNYLLGRGGWPRSARFTILPECVEGRVDQTDFVVPNLAPGPHQIVFADLDGIAWPAIPFTLNDGNNPIEFELNGFVLRVAPAECVKVTLANHARCDADDLIISTYNYLLYWPFGLQVSQSYGGLPPKMADGLGIVERVLPAGEYRLLVAKFDQPARVLEVVLDRDVELKIPVQTAHRVGGTIKTADGKNIRDVELRVVATSQSGERRCVATGEVRDGEYGLFQPLEPGDYQIEFTCVAVPSWREIVALTVPVDPPSPPDVSSQRLADLDFTREEYERIRWRIGGIRCDLVLKTAPPSVTVSGLVVDADGKPMDGAQIARLDRRDPSAIREAFGKGLNGGVCHGGRFSETFPRGQIRLLAMKDACHRAGPVWTLDLNEPKLDFANLRLVYRDPGDGVRVMASDRDDNVRQLDFIRAIDNRPVRTHADILAAVDEAILAGRDSVKFFILRGDTAILVRLLPLSARHVWGLPY